MTENKLISFLKEYKGFAIVSCFFALIYVAVNLLIPIFVGFALDGIIGKGNVDFIKVYKILAVIFIGVIVTFFANFFMNIINNKIAYKLVNNLRQKAFKNLLYLPLSEIDRGKSGDILSRIIADAEQVSDGLLLGIVQIFTGVCTILGTIIIMYILNWQIASIVVILTPLSLFVAKFIAKKTFNLFKNQSVIRGEQTAFINEMVPNQKLIKAYLKEEDNIKEFNKINARLNTASFKATFYSSLVNPSTRFINSIVYAAVACFGGIFALNGAITVGVLSSFLAYANHYSKPFNEISGVLAELQNANACANRLFSLIEKQPENDSEKQSIGNINGDICAKNIDFSYIESKPLIKNLSFDVKSGSKVAVVGPTGCGKTTLINLLMRFYDIKSGEILIDGKNVKNYTKESIRKCFGMVLQETWLKSASVKENIAFAKKDATEEEIIAAAKAAHCHNFIMGLKDGYDTVLDGGGENLSAGQKQLLCIARIMLDPPKMLILDEATSSIDTRTEQKINDAFKKLTKGRTSFIVAHRLSTILDSDIIFVMNKGVLVEQGTHEQLLSKNGFYANIYNSQFVK